MISIVFDIRHFVLSVQAETLIYQSTDLVSMEKEKHKKKIKEVSLFAQNVHVLVMQLLCGGNVPPHCLVYEDKVLTVLPAKRQHWTGL